MMHDWKIISSGWECARCGQHGGNQTGPMLAGGWECEPWRGLKADHTVEVKVIVSEGETPAYRFGRGWEE